MVCGIFIFVAPKDRCATSNESEARVNIRLVVCCA